MQFSCSLTGSSMHGIAGVSGTRLLAMPIKPVHDTLVSRGPIKHMAIADAKAGGEAPATAKKGQSQSKLKS